MQTRNDTTSLQRALERKILVSKVKEMVIRGKWFPDVEETERLCIYRDGTIYWTIPIATYECHIFIITIRKSKYSEIKMFKVRR